MKLPRVKTVRGRLFVGIVGIVAAYVVLSWTLNWQFLESYYRREKTASLISHYRSVRKLYDTGDSAALSLGLETMERKEGLVITVVDAELNTVYSSAPVRPQIRPHELPIVPPGENGQRFPDAVTHVAEEPDSEYVIYGPTRDDRLKLDFIALLGILSDGGYVSLRASLAPMQESASAANRFFLISGTLMAVIGAMLAYGYAARFTKPVEEMKIIAERVAQLDFSSEYSGHQEDEIGALGTSINTMSKRLAEAIRDLTEANRQLQEDVQRERKIDEMRKEFISSVSHELKTPIALIQGYAEGLKLNVNEDEENKGFYCDVIIDEAARMNRLVAQLLRLNQIESGHMQPNRVVFDIVELVGKVVRKNGLSLEEHHMTLTVTGEPRMDVFADVDMIEQVLMNYVTNAINYAGGDGAINVDVARVELGTGAGAAAKARVTVFNSGEPIPEESMQSIWLAFYKADRARTRSIGGTGLGLSIVRAMQEAQGNACGCQNLEGGVAFWFDVDLAGAEG